MLRARKLGSNYSLQAKMAAQPKRRKTYQLPSGGSVSSPAAKKERVATSKNILTVPVAQTSGTNLRIKEAKTCAVRQAQEEGCTANFRIFDSPFGNFLVPVIPTRAELADNLLP